MCRGVWLGSTTKVMDLNIKIRIVDQGENPTCAGRAGVEVGGGEVEAGEQRTVGQPKGRQDHGGDGRGDIKI